MSSYKKSEHFYGRGIGHSVNAALEGVIHTLRTERNMRVHFLAGFLVLILGIYLNLSAQEFMLLCFAVTFVLVAEMFNTAVEHAVDLIEKEFHPVAKIIKDIAAGAVFVSAVNAAIVGYLVLFKRVRWTSGLDVLLRLQHSPWHITLIALIVVVGMVLLIKVIRNEKYLLRGGMPSGHAAVAFAVWMVVSLVTANILVSILVFFMAILIARSRMAVGIHTLWEILAGSVLGALVALIVFQVLS